MLGYSWLSEMRGLDGGFVELNDVEVPWNSLVRSFLLY